MIINPSRSLRLSTVVYYPSWSQCRHFRLRTVASIDDKKGQIRSGMGQWKGRAGQRKFTRPPCACFKPPNSFFISLILSSTQLAYLHCLDLAYWFYANSFSAVDSKFNLPTNPRRFANQSIHEGADIQVGIGKQVWGIKSFKRQIINRNIQSYMKFNFTSPVLNEQINVQFDSKRRTSYLKHSYRCMLVAATHRVA